MTRIYRYVGPQEIKSRATTQPAGKIITCPADVLPWMRQTGQNLGRDELLVATYVIDVQEQLLIADRHSEHVACAGGGDVLAAGEIFFMVESGAVRVPEISNHSTGYCPEPESWQVVKRVLDRIGFYHPAEFSTVCIFRRCTRCGERNIVKDGWFFCDVCGEELNRKWNFA